MRSVLLVEVPDAEAAVGALQARLDPAASVGVPAHITVLYPFVPADVIDDEVIGRLDGLFADVAPFEFVLSRTAWFGDEVLYLRPEPDAGLRALTRSVVAAFPDHPPYEGKYGTDARPHLTVANGAGTPDERRAAELTVTPHLPIATRASAVTLMTELPSGRWQRRSTFDLGGRSDRSARLKSGQALLGAPVVVRARRTRTVRRCVADVLSVLGSAACHSVCIRSYVLL